MIFMIFLLTQLKLLNAISSSKKNNVKECNEENYEQSTQIIRNNQLNKNKEYFK
jgi:hypothetical protein